MVAYHDVPMSLLPFALYTLVHLDPDDLDDLLRTVSETSTQTEQDAVVRLPSQSHRIDGPLRAAFDRHLQLGRENQFDPHYFLAVTSQDWRKEGILIVTLDDDRLECMVDKCFVHAQGSGLLLVNLQIANMDWYEIKEHYALDRATHDTSAHNDDDDNGDDGDDGDDSDGTGHSGRDQGGGKAVRSQQEASHPTPGATKTDHKSEDDFKDDAPDKKPPAGFYIGIYVTAAITYDQVLPSIQPAYGLQPADDYICRYEGTLQAGSQMVQEACGLHPQRCSANKHLHKDLFIVVDSTDTTEDGVVLVSLGLKGTNKSKTKSAPSRSGDDPTHRHRRIPCDPGKTIHLVCSISRGSVPWTCADPCFALYMTTPVPGSEVLPFFDRLWHKRGDGEERVIAPPGSRLWEMGSGTGDAVKDWPTITRAHLDLCHQQRFRPNFHRQLLILLDTDKPKDEGVVLVQIDWDGNVKKSGEQQLAITRNEQLVSWCRCPAEEVYQTLSDVAGGQRTWTAVLESFPSRSAGVSGKTG